MRTVITLSGSLLLLGLSMLAFQDTRSQETAKQRHAAAVNSMKKLSEADIQNHRLSYLFFQPDTPIIIMDGQSIHFRKESGVVMSNNWLAKAGIDTTAQWRLKVYGCGTHAAGCSSPSTVNLVSPWTVSFFHPDDTQAVTVSFPDHDTPDQADIQIPDAVHPRSKFSAVSGSAGQEIFQSFYRLAYAKVNNVKYGCPTPDGDPTGCYMQIEVY